MPRLLNLVVAIYLIIVGLMGLNAIYTGCNNVEEPGSLEPMVPWSNRALKSPDSR
jgi:hypothetical protein